LAMIGVITASGSPRVARVTRRFHFAAPVRSAHVRRNRGIFDDYASVIVGPGLRPIFDSSSCRVKLAYMSAGRPRRIPPSS
jgi:hypothetical protein